MIAFTVQGIPSPQGSVRAFVVNGRAVVTQGGSAERRRNLSDWRGDVQRTAKHASNGRMFLGPVRVGLIFWLPRPASAPKARRYPDKRPDLDKLVRAVLDALTGSVWRDDAQVVQIDAGKDYAAAGEPPGVRVVIAEVDGAQA